MPHSIEAEEYLISCCLLDGADVVGKCLLAKIKPASFYDPKHGIIYSTILELYVANKAIEISSVAEELKLGRQLDAVGGYAFLAQVSSRIPTTAQATFFIEKVIEQATLRSIIASATGVVEDCYGYSGGLEEFVAGIDQRMQRAMSDHLPEPVKTWPMAILEAEVQANAMIGGADGGVMTFGLNDLDTILAKGRRGELIIVAARPGVGKSSLARHIVRKNAIAGLVVQMNSLEVPSRDIALQMASSESGVSLRELPRCHERDRATFFTALHALKIPGLHVFDDDYSVGKIIARARALRPDVLVIDYLGLIHDCNPGKGETKAQAVGNVTKALKRLAIDMDIVIVLLAQLNRQSMTDGNREPRLDDLRDSGDIEQDADRVIFLHLPAANAATGQSQNPNSSPLDEPSFYVNAIQAKGRNVGTGSCGLLFKRSIATFIQIDRRAA